MLEIISNKILKMPLLHISSERLIAGDATAISNLLQIFNGLVDIKQNGGGLVDSPTEQQKEAPADNEKHSPEINSICVPENTPNPEIKPEVKEANQEESESNSDSSSSSPTFSLSESQLKQRYLRRKLIECLAKNQSDGAASSSKQSEIVTVNDSMEKYLDDEQDRMRDVALVEKQMSQRESRLDRAALNTLDDDLTIITNLEGDNLEAEEKNARISRNLKNLDEIQSWRMQWLLEDAETQKHGEQRVNDNSKKQHQSSGAASSKSASHTKMQKIRNLHHQVCGNGNIRQKHYASKAQARRGENTSFVRPTIRLASARNRADAIRAASRGVSSTIGRDDEETNMAPTLLQNLLRQFPHLELRPETLRQLCSKAAQIQQCITSASIGENDQSLTNCRRKEKEIKSNNHKLANQIQKDAEVRQRLADLNEKNEAERNVRFRLRDQRLQTVRCRKYQMDFERTCKAQQMHKEIKEEQLFRNLFNEAIKMQRERLLDMRAQKRQMEKMNIEEQKKNMESLENYYQDRFSILAEFLKSEKESLDKKGKVQNLMLNEMKKEIREKLKREIQEINEDQMRNEDSEYFRYLDAKQALSNLPAPY